MTGKPDFIEFERSWYSPEGRMVEMFYIKGKPPVSAVLEYLKDRGFDLDNTIISGSSALLVHTRPPTELEIAVHEAYAERAERNQEAWERKKLSELLQKYRNSQ